MNIFFIPSWYPSETDPLPGIFFKEQALALAKQFPDINIGISVWGQNDERFLLWSGKPLKSINKILKRSTLKATLINTPFRNVVEYLTPTFTWSSKLFHGNINQIIKANLYNLKQFEDQYGKADLIHSHVGFPAGFIAKKISELHAIPFVVTEQMSPFPHTNFINRSGKLSNKLMLAYQSSSRNIAISHVLADSMKTVNIHNISTIPNLVDELFFIPSKANVKPKEFTFFSLGRMVPQKGIDILLNAFARIESKVYLRIGGDGKYLKQYKKLAKSLALTSKITWLGALDKNQALNEYQNCSAFVLPSRHESMGVVFVEAMACGKPVIGTISGGPEEFINKTNGYLVSPHDEKELARAMEKMIENIHLFNPDTIRTQFENRFSSRVVCRQIMDVYTEVIHSHKNK